EEQRRQPGCPAGEVVLLQPRHATSRTLSNRLLVTGQRSVAPLVRSPTREVLLVIRAARPAVDRLLRVRAERPAPAGRALYELPRDDPVCPTSLLDPVDERRRPIHRVGTIPPGAMKHTGEQKRPKVIGRLGVTGIHLLVIADACERRQRSVRPPVPEDQLSA